MSELYLFKILAVHSQGVHPYRVMIPSCEDIYTDAESIGMRCMMKGVTTRHDQSCRFQIWNLIPNIRHRVIFSSYAMGTRAAFVFFDMCRRATYDSLFYWIRFLRSVENDVIIFIIGLNNGPNRMCEEREVNEFAHIHSVDRIYILDENADEIPDHLFVEIAEKIIARAESGLLEHGSSLTPPDPPEHPPYECQTPYPRIPPAPRDDCVDYLNGAALPPLSCFANNNIFEEHIRNFVHRTEPLSLRRINDMENDENRQLMSLRDEMLHELDRLRNIMRGDHISNYRSELLKLSDEHKITYQNFVEFYKICPICGGRNHKSYLTSFFFSKDPQRLQLKDVLLHYMDACIENPHCVDSEFIYGIPCCHCYKQVFNESDAPRG